MTSPRHEKKRSHSPWRIPLIILLVVALALGAVAGGYAWLYYRGRHSLLHTGSTISAPSNAVQEDDLISYNGHRYKYNENISATLVMGVDKKDIQIDGGYGTNGQADAIFIMALDTATGDIHMIPLSRETMVDVDIYAADGTYSGVEKTQLCLAYAYATEGDAACRNVARSVSRILYGIPLKKYVAIDLGGVEALTNAVDGVPLTALETVKSGNTVVVKEGQTVTLRGKDAIAYIQTRDQDTNANNRRMARQKQFFTAFIRQAAQLVQKSPTRLPGLYNTAKPYMVSNVSLSELTFLAGCTMENGGFRHIQYHPITGDTVMGEEHVEFYAHIHAAYEAVLATFYTQVD